jgi:hypothetical protein
MTGGGGEMAAAPGTTSLRTATTIIVCLHPLPLDPDLYSYGDGVVCQTSFLDLYSYSL